MALLKERDIERHLVREVKKLGGEIRKVKWIGRRNAPDRRVMLPGFCFWCEVKRPGEWATPAQAREHTVIRRTGETVYVLNTIESINKLLGAHRAKIAALVKGILDGKA